MPSKSGSREEQNQVPRSGPGASRTPAPNENRGRVPWLPLLILSVIFVGATDLAFLARSKDFLASGYNTYALQGTAEVLGFITASAFFDAVLLLGLWLLLRPLISKVGGNPLQRLIFTAGLAACVPLAVNFILHRVHVVLGNVLALDSLFALAEGDAVGGAMEALATTSATLIVIGALAALLAVGWGARELGRRFGEGLEAESLRSVGSLAGIGLLAALGLLLWSDAHAPKLTFGLEWKASGMVIRALGSRATDFDRDGAGLLSRPTDFAPFDAGRHTFALEIPGNGIDENGLGGDLPLEVPTQARVSTGTKIQPGGPSVVMVFLETFRSDLIDLDFNGKPLTPTLRRIAREGSSTDVYTHTPMTWSARSQLMQGRVVPRPGHSTLIDDFLHAGYEVAWFSGQHDGLRDGEKMLGTDRADVFSDARDNLGARTSPSAHPVSLQISWKTLLSEVEGYLQQRRQGRPLFLYVNVVDTHFPYDHGSLDDILGVHRADRSEIRRDNREMVWQTYLNAVANVDRAVGRLLQSVEESLGGEAFSVVITADHGEAFYEDGFLGHGQSLEDRQSRVPLIVRGFSGDWPLPLGLADLRGLLTTHLGAASGVGRPTFTPDPERRLFQFSGKLDRPKSIALRGADWSVSHTFVEPAPVDPGEGFDEMIHAWEALRLQVTETGTD